MANFNELIATEKTRFKRASFGELRSVSVALSLHSHENTLEEQARREAVDQLISERCKAKRSKRKGA